MDEYRTHRDGHGVSREARRFSGSVLLRRMDKLVISEATASVLALAAASASTLLRGERQRFSEPPLAFSELPALFLFLLARR